MQNHLRLLEHYQQYSKAVHSLMESMMASLSGAQLLSDQEQQQQAVRRLSQNYPFIELMYSLDSHGVQLMDTVFSPHVSYRKRRQPGKGRDRSQRPYMQILQHRDRDVSVTEPYLSSATHQLAISCVQTIQNSHGDVTGYVVLNFNLQRLISYLKGDQLRERVHPAFQGVYAIIGGLLVIVSLLLLAGAGKSLLDVFQLTSDVTTGAFGIVILITLGLAIFDLGKTILEEEVLSNKDIHHHDTSRRTITRFMSAIVIAISIESLLLMFKSLLAESDTQVLNAVWMMMAAVALLMALGVYLKLSKEQLSKE